MRHTTSLAITSLLFVLSMLCLSASTAQSQEKPSEAERAKMMAAYAELSKPGPEHKQLESLVGTWDQDIKFWLQPGKPPMTVKGRCQNKMILGGRFLLSEAKAEGPMAFENMTIIGFDRRHKKYTTVSLDTEGTYYVTAAGPFDDSRKAIVMYGEDIDPALGHTQKYDMVIRITSPTTYVLEVIFKDPEHTGGQKEFKVVEVTHTRK